MFGQDSDLFPIKCPHCNEEFHEKIGSIEAGLDSRCPGCGIRITHPAEQFRRLIEGRGKPLEDYLRQFIRL